MKCIIYICTIFSLIHTRTTNYITNPFFTSRLDFSPFPSPSIDFWTCKYFIYQREKTSSFPKVRQIKFIPK